MIHQLQIKAKNETILLTNSKEVKNNALVDHIVACTFNHC